MEKNDLQIVCWEWWVKHTSLKIVFHSLVPIFYFIPKQVQDCTLLFLVNIWPIRTPFMASVSSEFIYIWVANLLWD